jgi:hypothetical protein
VVAKKEKLDKSVFDGLKVINVKVNNKLIDGMYK